MLRRDCPSWHGQRLCMQARRELECSCCRQRYGACIQCAFSRSCFTAFHPLCARSQGLFMTPVDDGAQHSDSDADQPSAALAPAGPPAPGRVRQQGSGRPAQKRRRPMQALRQRAGSSPTRERRASAVSPTQHSEEDVARWVSLSSCPARMHSDCCLENSSQIMLLK